MQNLYVMGDITERQYKVQREELMSMMPEMDSPAPPVDLDRVIAIMRNLDDVWEEATDLEKQTIYSLLIEQVIVHQDNVLEVVPSTTLALIWDAATMADSKKWPTHDFASSGVDGSRTHRGLLCATRHQF